MKEESPALPECTCLCTELPLHQMIMPIGSTCLGAPWADGTGAWGAAVIRCVGTQVWSEPGSAKLYPWLGQDHEQHLGQSYRQANADSDGRPAQKQEVGLEGLSVLCALPRCPLAFPSFLGRAPIVGGEIKPNPACLCPPRALSLPLRRELSPIIFWPHLSLLLLPSVPAFSNNIFTGQRGPGTGTDSRTPVPSFNY